MIANSSVKGYMPGTVVQLTAKPAKGWRFIKWTDDLNSTKNPSRVTINKPKTVTVVFKKITGGKAIVNITIDWNSLNDALANNNLETTLTSNLTSRSNLNAINKESSSISDSITNFGARLIYINDNAVFSQSVKKSIAVNKGIITLNVPPTDKARLFAVAVRHKQGVNKVYLMGVINNLSIKGGKNTIGQ